MPPFGRKAAAPDPCPGCVALEVRRVAALETLAALIPELIASNSATVEALTVHRHRLERLDGRLNRLELWAEAWGDAHPHLVPPYPGSRGAEGLALVPTQGGRR